MRHFHAMGQRGAREVCRGRFQFHDLVEDSGARIPSLSRAPAKSRPDGGRTDEGHDSRLANGPERNLGAWVGIEALVAMLRAASDADCCRWLS